MERDTNAKLLAESREMHSSLQTLLSKSELAIQDLQQATERERRVGIEDKAQSVRRIAEVQAAAEKAAKDSQVQTTPSSNVT